MNAARIVPVMLLSASAALAAPQETPPPFLESSCVTACHGAERTKLEASVHAQVLACVDCHGGDPDAHRDRQRAHAPEAGYRGMPERREVPDLCAACHSDPLRMFASGLPTDQLAHYRMSTHGRAMLERDETAAATCTDCHGTHGILAADDPRAPTAPARQPATCGRCHADAELMERFDLPTDMVERFEHGVHGRALLVEQSRGAPTCSSCHGSHGATPPGVADLVHVCAQCHPRTGAYFRNSAHFGADEMRCGTCHEEQADQPGYRLSGCAACHGAHDIETPGDDSFRSDAVGACGHCHRPDDGVDVDIGNVDLVIDAVINGRRRLQEAMADTAKDLEAAKRTGLFLENEAVMLRESRSALVLLEPLSHALQVAAIEDLVTDGLERQEMAREALGRQQDVLRDRRILVTGLVLLLLMLAGLLGTKLSAIRRLS